MKNMGTLKFFSFFLLLTLGTACNKDKSVTKLSEAKMSETYLTSKKWRVNEVFGVRNNSYVSYKRGKAGNTESFDNLYMVFKLDSISYFVDNFGTKHIIKNWEFVDSEKTKLSFTVSSISNLVNEYVWDNIRIKKDTLYMDSYHTDNSNYTRYHGQEKWY